MISILSPAKTINMQASLPTVKTTLPAYIKEAEVLMQLLKNIEIKDLQKMMNISLSLAEINKERFEKWTIKHTLENSIPAAFAYNGDVYQGLQVETLSNENLSFAQDRLFVISGLYGILRPLDLIMPYRLEMGIPLVNSKGKTLYHYWKQAINDFLIKHAKNTKSKVLMNLASVEYSKVIDIKQLNLRVISPEFKEFKDDKLKIVSFYAKRARGLMAKYIVENEITNPDDIKHFESEGYKFLINESTEDKWVFAR